MVPRRSRFSPGWQHRWESRTAPLPRCRNCYRYRPRAHWLRACRSLLRCFGSIQCSIRFGTIRAFNKFSRRLNPKLCTNKLRTSQSFPLRQRTLQKMKSRRRPSSPRRIFDRTGVNLFAVAVLCSIFIGSMRAEQSPAERVAEIQAALRDAKLDGWLFYDFRHSDPLAYRILKLDGNMFASRRWFYYVPVSGEPIKIVQSIEQFKLDSLPGKKLVFRGWQELHG